MDRRSVSRFVLVNLFSVTAEGTGIALGDPDSCALLTDSTIKCLGYNVYGQLGDGTITTRTTPFVVDGLPCDASTAPSDGTAGDCTNSLARIDVSKNRKVASVVRDPRTARRSAPNSDADLETRGFSAKRRPHVSERVFRPPRVPGTPHVLRVAVSKGGACAKKTQRHQTSCFESVLPSQSVM